MDPRWAAMEAELSAMEARLKAETATLPPPPSTDGTTPEIGYTPPTPTPEPSEPSGPEFDPLEPTDTPEVGLPQPSSPLPPGAPIPEISRSGDGVGKIGDCAVDPQGYGGSDCNTDELLRYSSLALRTLADLLKLSSTITTVGARLEYENAIRSAYAKIQQDQAAMLNASERLSTFSGDIMENNQRINEVYSNLSEIQRSMGNELTNIATLASSISSVDTRLTSYANDLANAEAQMRAVNRSNYPAGSLGLSQMRSDLRSFTQDMFNINSAIADLQNTRADYIAQMNSAGERYNNLLPSADSARSSLGYAYDLNSQYEADRNAAAQQYNLAGERIGKEFNNILSAQKDYRNLQLNAMTLGDLSTGSRGIANALDNIAAGNNYTAAADIMNSGMGPLLRNFAPALSQYGGFFTGLIADAGRSADQTIRSGGSFSDGMENFMLNAGQRFLGVKDGIRVANSLDMVSTYLDNNDIDGAGMVLESVTIPSAIQMGSTLAQTGLAAMGMAPLSGVVQGLTPAATAAVVGPVSTLRNMTLAEVSQPLTPSEPRKIGRGLIVRETSGAPSALTVGLVGSLITAETVAVAGVRGLMGQNPQVGANLSMRISDMATQGGTVNWPRQLEPGDVKLVPPAGAVTGD